MTTDINTFFRETTIRICGNLEIEQALLLTITYFQKYMPVDRMYLQLFDYHYGSMRTICEVTKDLSKEVDLLTPLSDRAKEAMKNADFSQLPDVIILENPYESIIGREMLDFHNIRASSIIILSLITKDKPLGSLILISESEQRFSQEHANLIKAVKDPFSIAMSNALKHREVLTLKELVMDDNKYLKDEIRRISGDTIIGSKSGLQAVMYKVQQVAAMNSPVLIQGETGVGKDLIASAIHYTSTRNDGPFVSVNCGAIPESLIDSELFGHEKGAFTNAVALKRGRFERANHGTIFLDEVGELPLQAQVRLLRVLQNREIERIGGTKTLKIDIRIIAATNKNLMEMVRSGNFREDLWFRLNVFPIEIPPLRARMQDIPVLVRYFITLKAKELKLNHIPELADNAIDMLMSYHWPGNVRELENIIERALILDREGPLSFENLKPATRQYKDSPQQIDYGQTLDDVMRNHITRILAQTSGRVHGPGGAADILRINPSTLRNRMNKLGIKYGKKN